MPRPGICEAGHMQDTTETGEAWRDEWCPTCRGNRQHHKGSDGRWRCDYCHTEADPHTARRLDGAESNKRKQTV
jgi:ribosomal protein L37AE/L43A